MQLSFSQDNEELRLELSVEKYKKLMQIIKQSSDEAQALSFCENEEAFSLCKKFISYEFSHKTSREKTLTELDASCDYDDHL